MLVYFGWTAAEALNLYFSLVKVFEAKTIGSYALKAGLIVWREYIYRDLIQCHDVMPSKRELDIDIAGINFRIVYLTVVPLGVVIISAGAGYKYYISDV